MSIWWRIFLGYLLVVLVALATVSIYLSHELTQHQVASLRATLFSQAVLVRDVVAGDFATAQGRAHLNAAARRLDRQANVRVTFIAGDGTVLGDSEHDFRSMVNHASRPEVRQALASGRGSSIRYSQTIGTQMLYVAIPLKQDATDVGVVRLAVPLHQIAASIRRLRSMVLVAALLALGIALLLSLRLAHGMGAGIRALARGARSLAEGNLDAQVRVRGRDEIGALGATFNEMAARLRIMVRELREEKGKTEAILQRLGDAILVTDSAGRITVMNQAAERAFGISFEQVVGLTVVNATQNHALDEAFRQALATGRTMTAEVQILFPQPRTLETTVTPIAAEEPVGAVAVLHDVTDLRRLERIRREFVANASHELQTPVTAIKAVTEALLGDARDDPALVERFLADLRQQADRLGALVRDLLDLASMEAGPVPLDRVAVAVAEAVRGVTAQVEPVAQQFRVSLAVEVPDDLTVFADRAALDKILKNLLDNAIKYNERGGKAGVRAARQDDRVAITVWDTGIGILSTELPRIFERFYRVDKSRSRELGGTGLGLSIVKHLTEAMGGHVSVESEPGKGSRFAVTLPAGGRLPTP
jgi:two-component system phosphate regulon sensor histidine kinase PhoR